MSDSKEKHPSIGGIPVEVDTSEEACKPFDLSSGDRVNVEGVGEGEFVGVAKNPMGASGCSGADEVVRWFAMDHLAGKVCIYPDFASITKI